MVRPSKKATYSLFGIIVFIGVLVWGAGTFVEQFPSSERESVWRWFFGGWATSAIAVLIYLSWHWIKGTINKPDPDRAEEMQYYVRIMPWAAGAFGVLSAGLGIATSSTALVFLSLGCGGFTGLFILGIALNATQKGRAMLDSRD